MLPGMAAYEPELVDAAKRYGKLVAIAVASPTRMAQIGRAHV